MKIFEHHIRAWGASLHPIAIATVVVALFTFWTMTLDAFGQHFALVSGRQLLDLQNVSRILAPSEALALIQGYDANARSLYWTFFILDNAVPLVVFGSLSLIWVNILKRHTHRLAQGLLNSAFILLPLGVGLFDIAENVYFVSAISAPADANALPMLTVGLIFVQIKAICLFCSFGVTALLLVLHLISRAWGFVRRASSFGRREAA